MAALKFKLASTLLAALALAACSSKDQTVNYFAGNESQLYNQATQALENGKYTNAEQLLTQLSLQYPFGNYNTQVQVMQAYSYYKADNYSLAVSSVDKFFTNNYVGAQYGDYMLILRVLSTIEGNRGFFQNLFNLNPADNDQTDFDVASADLQTLLKNYPNSPYADYARELLTYVTYIQAESNFKVAQTYLKYGNPLAAYKRANVVVYNFPDTTYAPKALELIQQAATQINLDVSAEVKAIQEKISVYKDLPKQPEKMPTHPDLTPPFLHEDAARAAQEEQVKK